MPTFQGWDVVTMPASPAPKDISFSSRSYAAVSQSDFTGQQQIQDWQSNLMMAKVSMPPMTGTTAAAWVTFLLSLRGPIKVFQFSTVWAALATWTYPTGYTPTGYWRLKSGQPAEWSISEALIFGLSFEIEEAK